ncbi:MAG: hypothetical protein HKP30_18160 [Myxococcales bacterium]|nr:hypothetical protein [Myxococcales bacterium]
MRPLKTITLAGLLLSLAAFGTGCNRTTAGVAGGVAVGAGGAGAAYEYQNRKALEEIEEEFADGEIDREEYLKRKREIEKRSVIY